MPIVPRLKSPDLNQIGKLLLCAWDSSFGSGIAVGLPMGGAALLCPKKHNVLKSWFCCSGSQAVPDSPVAWSLSQLHRYLPLQLVTCPIVKMGYKEFGSLTMGKGRGWLLRLVGLLLLTFSDCHCCHGEHFLWAERRVGLIALILHSLFHWRAGPLTCPPVPTRLFHICHLRKQTEAYRVTDWWIGNQLPVKMIFKVGWFPLLCYFKMSILYWITRYLRMPPV